MTKPKVCILKTDGINCERETAHAFTLCGGDPEIVHINSLIRGYDPIQQKPKRLSDYQILAIPGGFSYGDYIAAGRVLAEELKHFLQEQLREFVHSGKPIIGICNGFQVLVKYGLLPALTGEPKQEATLTYNESGRFEDRWVRLRKPEDISDTCIWTKGIESIDLPVAHGEGKFVAPDRIVRELFSRGLVVFQYVDSEGKPTSVFPSNPNGSLDAIAAICDPTGLVFGLMPHPERYNSPQNHALAPLQRILARGYVDKTDPFVAERVNRVGELPKEGAGLQILRNGVDYVVNNLLR